MKHLVKHLHIATAVGDVILIWLRESPFNSSSVSRDCLVELLLNILQQALKAYLLYVSCPQGFLLALMAT